MTDLFAPSVYEWYSGEFTEPIEGQPDPGPGYEPPVVPDQDGAQGEEFYVAVSSFGPGTPGAVRGIFWGAVIESLTEADRGMGGNRLSISVPLTAHNMRVWGAPSLEVDQQGEILYHARGSVARELLVGSNLDGRPMWRFFVRDEVRFENGSMKINAVGIIGGLTADRLMGSVRGPRNRLTVARGSFEQGDLTRWEEVGDCEAQIQSGGADGNYYVRVRGTPNGQNFLRASARWTIDDDIPEAGQMLGGAYVWIPPELGPEIEGYGLVEVRIFDYDTLEQLWPRPNQGNPSAGVVLPDMQRGVWLADQVQAEAWGRWAPFDVIAEVRLHPLDETHWTRYDNATLVTPTIAGLYAGIDRSYGVRTLFQDAQLDTDKSTWQVGVEVREMVGSLDDPVLWRYDDNPPMDECLEALCAEEPPFEVWDDATNGRNVAVALRRGEVRDDIRIQPWDVLARVSWVVDPGAQRTAVRGQNVSGSSVLGSIDAGAIDTTAAGGHVIDVTMQGPKEMRQRALVSWVRQQLSRLSILQGSMTVMVTWRCGMRLSVGDTVRVAVSDGQAVHTDWMRVMSKTPDLQGLSGVLLVLGTDVDLGGR